MKKPHLSIIIPVLNLWSMTSNCLESLRKFTKGNFFEVIVVDNGSVDSTPTECPVLGQRLFPDKFKYVRVEENINFGPACNLGAANALGELLFFLNNDTLLSEGWAAPLLEIFNRDPGVMAASPLCLFPDNRRIQYLGIGYTGALGVRHPYFMFPGDHPVVRRQRKFQALSAAALMVPSHYFNGLGGFFPDYANGFEDMDLCCRIRRAGGRLMQENSSVVYHWASKTPGRNRHDRKNMELINNRCGGCFKPDLHRIAMEDGFCCELTPWLEMIMREADAKALGRLDNLFSEDEVNDALHEYPLWEKGYDRLSAIYCEQGRLEEASDILYYGAIQFPDLGRFVRLEDLSGRAGRIEWQQQAAGKITLIKQSLSIPQNLFKQAQNVLGWARSNKDFELAHIYENWLNADIFIGDQ